MSLLATLRVAVVAATLVAPSLAEVQVFGGPAARMAATEIFWDNGPVGMVCVQYGQPAWKAEYDTMLDTLKGKQLRLGKDFWTTLNSSVALTIGETKVEAGSYYLALKCDAEGAFHLLLLKAEAADKQGFAPFVPDAMKADYTCPMKRTATETSVDKMTMDFATDEKDTSRMTFTVAWGKHLLSVPVQVHLAAAK